VRARDEFLSIASHELRTPLASLQLAVQRLRRAGNAGRSPEQLDQTVERMERQVRRLNRLIGQLLDVTRIRSEQLDLEVGRVDYGRLLYEVAEGLQGELERAGCALTVEVPEAQVVGEGDWERLDQVFVNLISNALKYGAGSPVRVRLSQLQGHAWVEVEDGGIGIAPEDQERIFGRFERGVSTRHYGGLGLGLYIIRRIVETHGGEVGVRSEPGQGSTFWVRVPLARPQTAAFSERPVRASTG
jgi:signal transduction histidine kinase